VRIINVFLRNIYLQQLQNRFIRQQLSGSESVNIVRQENENLKKENAQLKKQVEELQAKVSSYASSKLLSHSLSQLGQK